MLTRIQTQLTVVRWYLDAAVSTAAESVRQNIQVARHTYEGILLALSQLDLQAGQRQQLEKELSAVRERIEAAEAA